MTEQLSVPLRVTAQAPVPAQSLKRGEPCTMVILGAGGDLTRRKLIPALFHLRCDGLLPDDFDVIGVARARMSDESFRDLVHGVLAETNALGEMDESEWRRFAAHLWYLSGDLGDPSVYSVLRKRVVELEERRAADRGRLFYLALPPSVYATTVRHLAASGIAPRLRNRGDRPWARVIIEKPFGNSLGSAQVLNRVVGDAFAEHQVYRIDHYLGKETVQNILVFRFANSIFEPVWNRNHICRVQITAAESVGIEHRAGYYEEAGVVRDMFQNHLLQLLSLTAMEPPVTFRADAVRDEKAKVLGAIRPISESEIHSYAVRGQYGAGIIDGKPVPGYREEEGVARDSTTPTYAALRLMIDNWRWQGVPFFLCSGKRMPRRATDITIQFRQPPHLMFPLDTGEAIAPNVVTIRVQPNEGISLCFQIKMPGVGIRMTSATMDFTYAEAFGSSDHSAYETLLLDCMAGDATLFNRSDAVEAAWRVVDPVIEAWHQKTPEHFPNYAAGTWGPAVANEFIRRDAAKA